jgi:hypothetical protein
MELTMKEIFKAINQKVMVLGTLKMVMSLKETMIKLLSHSIIIN